VAPKREHFRTAERNLQVLQVLQDDGRFPEWIVVTAFYRAVHLVEGVFALESGPRHSASPEERNQPPRTEKRYANIWKHFRPLMSLSVLAR